MIKLLIENDVIVYALTGQNSDCLKAVQAMVSSDQALPWVLATVNAELAAQGLSADKIQKGLEGISQIPVNAKLSNDALNAGGGFQEALTLAAAKTFKCTRIVSVQGGLAEDGIQHTTVVEAQDLPEADNDRVDFMNLSYPVHTIFNEVDGWQMDIIQNTAFAGGTHVNAFEEEFAKYCGTKYAIGVASGTDALLYALIAMGVGEGDEVITQPNTFIATTEAISQCGATPVFADVLEGSYNLDPAKIEAAITPKTKAILPVHLYGQMADMDSIEAIAKKHNLLILEDACQAHGAEYKGRRAGSIGSAGAFSLYPGKNLGAYGEAGAVSTNDEKIYNHIKSLREHGQSKKYYHQYEGYNGRMDNIQAAAVRAKIPHLDAGNVKRRAIAAKYCAGLSDVKEVTLPIEIEGASPVYHLFVILVPDNMALHEYLKEQKIFTGFHYPLPLHLQEAYSGMNLGKGSFKVTEESAEHLLSLPMLPELTENQVNRVIDAIKSFYA